jgi:hypothetical protein
METTITNLLKSLAEALSPFLPSAGAADETTVSDERVTAIEEAVSNLPDVDEQIDEYLSYNFDPTDHDILTESRFDPSDFGLKTSDEITYEINEAVENFDIEERVTSCVEERIEEAVKAALDAANVVTTSTLLAYINAISMVVKGGDESSTFIAEGTVV